MGPIRTCRVTDGPPGPGRYRDAAAVAAHDGKKNRFAGCDLRFWLPVVNLAACIRDLFGKCRTGLTGNRTRCRSAGGSPGMVRLRPPCAPRSNCGGACVGTRIATWSCPGPSTGPDRWRAAAPFGYGSAKTEDAAPYLPCSRLRPMRGGENRMKSSRSNGPRGIAGKMRSGPRLWRRGGGPTDPIAPFYKPPPAIVRAI